MSNGLKDAKDVFLKGGAEALRAAVANAEPVETSEKAAACPSFPLIACDEVGAMEMPRDFVEGLLTEGGASVIYGESNVGKSFWILDLAAHVSMGKAWRYGEVEVDQGAVIYVALEGTHGMRNRIEAMKREGILSPGAPLYLCFAPVSLLDPTHGSKLAETVKAAAAQSQLPCRLVVIDTMARAMAGGNENAGEDMTAAVAVIDEVKAATGAHVAIVHHCGKDVAKGARGHSSLRAAVDTEVEVFRPEGEHISTVRVTKQRDLERGEPMPFSLKVVEVGTDTRGKPVTSCVVKHEDEIMASQPKKPGRKSTYTPEAMLEYLPAANATEWQKRATEDCGVSRTTFFELKTTLKAQEKFRAEVGTGRLVKA